MRDERLDLADRVDDARRGERASAVAGGVGHGRLRRVGRRSVCARGGDRSAGLACRAARGAAGGDGGRGSRRAPRRARNAALPTRSSRLVVNRPSRNGSDASSARWIGALVMTPSMTSSPSAARPRAIAASRVGRPDDELAEQRVVVRRHLVAGVDVRVEPDARAARGVEPLDRRRCPGRKSCSASSALIRNSIAWPRCGTSAWVMPERLAGRDPDLEGDEVDAGEHLGHRVLDLDPAVDLDEVGVAVVVDEELERADVLVAGGDDRAGSRAPRAPGGRRRVIAGDGDSSTIFWCRRWTEQSRSQRWTPCPNWSTATWISTWRLSSSHFSRYSESSPNAAFASERQIGRIAAQLARASGPCACPCRRRRPTA